MTFSFYLRQEFMEFISSVKDAFIKYRTLNGKADRPQFWWFQLFLWFGFIVSVVLDNLFFSRDFFLSASNIGFIGTLWVLFNFIPTVSIGVRRLHDTGRSGWRQLLFFAIIIGWILLIIWYCEETREDDPAKRPIGIPQ